MPAFCKRQTLHPIYLVEHQGTHARYFVETDRDSNSLNSIVEMIRSGDLKPVKIIEVDEEAGRVEDITEEVMGVIDPLRHIELNQDRAAQEADHRRKLRLDFLAS